METGKREKLEEEKVGSSFEKKARKGGFSREEGGKQSLDDGDGEGNFSSKGSIIEIKPRDGILESETGMTTIYEEVLGEDEAAKMVTSATVSSKGEVECAQVISTGRSLSAGRFLSTRRIQ
ncbi:hypothetical protein LWI28_005619 [Acer negundo]|uniref:Uncharacterized protein n=1 Tax=Acer negundo TaxID=4023 RepID=A0AAD5JVJ4_ACENE|nr:hypothetical protein LWI28_005619 [Acer negundo]